jgi:hypothetical protein
VVSRVSINTKLDTILILSNTDRFKMHGTRTNTLVISLSRTRPRDSVAENARASRPRPHLRSGTKILPIKDSQIYVGFPTDHPDWRL